jgi:hypothetical protein
MLEKFIIRNFAVILSIKCYSDDYIKDEDMGGTCSRYGWEMTNS